MKKKLILVLALVMTLALVLTACNGSASIASVLAEGKTNEEVAIKGTVFAKTSNMLFINDGTASIMVRQTKTDSFKVGDKVTVKGIYKVTENVPSIQQGSEVSVKGSETALAPTASSIDNLMALDYKTKTNFGKYVTVEAVVAKNANGTILYVGSQTNSVLVEGNTSALESFENHKVTISVVTTGAKKVAFCGAASDIHEVTIDVNTVKETLFAGLEIPADVYAALSLPTFYEAEPSVKFAWSVVSGSEAISISNNVATINDVAQDTAAKIKLTISSGSTTASKEFDINVKAIRTIAIKDLATETYAENEVVFVQGQVLAKGNNQIETERGVILADNDGNYARIDISAEMLANVEIGDTIKVAGKYGEASYGIKSINNVLSCKTVTAAPEGFAYDFANSNATSLATLDEYAALCVDRASKTPVLVKIVNPYVIYSGSTSYNFVRFGASHSTAKDGQTADTIYCFSINSFATSGVKDLDTTWSVPLNNQNAKLLGGYTLYAFGAYSGDTTWQFIIAGEDAIVFNAEEAAESSIKSYFLSTSISSVGGGTIDLPSKIGDLDITWTSSNDALLNATTGAFTEVVAATKVTLTANYTLDGAEKSCDVEFTLTADAAKVLTVTEAMSAEKDAIISSLTCYVAGTVPTHSGSGNANGLYVTDGTSLMVLSANGNITEGKANGKGGKTYYVIGEHTLVAGDKLTLTNVTVSQQGKKLSCNASTVATIDGHDNIAVKDWFKGTVATEIASQEDLAEYMLSITSAGSTVIHNKEGYEVIHFTATDEKPLYLKAQNGYVLNFSYDSSSFTFPSQVINKEAVVNYTFSVPHTMLVTATSEEWWKANSPVTANDLSNYGTTYDKNTYVLSGEAYFVFEYSGSTSYPYGYFGLLGGGFTLAPAVQEESVASLDAYVVGYVVPTSGSGNPGGLYLSTNGSDLYSLSIENSGIDLYKTGEKSGTSYTQAYAIADHVLKVGDKLTLTNLKRTGTAIKCTEETVTTLGDNIDVGGNWFTKSADVTVTSEEELANFMATLPTYSDAGAGKIVKVVATAEKPIYMGQRTGYILAFYYDASRTSVIGTTTTLPYYAVADGTLFTFSTHSTPFYYQMDEQWAKDNTPLTAYNTAKQYGTDYDSWSTAKTENYKFTGTFYLVFEATGSTTYPYSYFSVLGAGFDLTKVAE